MISETEIECSNLRYILHSKKFFPVTTINNHTVSEYKAIEV